MVKLISNRCQRRHVGGRCADGEWAHDGSSSDQRAWGPSSSEWLVSAAPPSSGPCDSSGPPSGRGARAGGSGGGGAGGWAAAAARVGRKHGGRGAGGWERSGAGVQDLSARERSLLDRT
jgi:hypothetical protein